MGHAINRDKEYRALGRKLDRSLTGAPDSPALRRILEILFSPEEAALAAGIPFSPTRLDRLAAKLGLAESDLDGRLGPMAGKGLVIDIELRGRRYVMLSPVVIGFFEMTFMRARDDLPQAELARLFREYWEADDRFVRTLFAGTTQLGRSLVCEEALPEGDFTEILDWERSTRLIESASSIAVSLCACRHHHAHEGNACDAPQRACLTLGVGAEALVRHGLGEKIDAREAMTILDECKRNGLAQTGDNVQRRPTYICNCCGCCCGMMGAIRSFDLRGAIVSSNWIATLDPAACRGCGTCEKACPVRALSMEPHKGEPAHGKKKQKQIAALEEGLCLGCGVCATACKFGALAMRPRERRVYTPETVFDKTVAMAIERGKLHTLIFADPERLSHKAMARILAVIEQAPPVRALIAIEPLKSRYLAAVTAGARKAFGGLARDIG